MDCFSNRLRNQGDCRFRYRNNETVCEKKKYVKRREEKRKSEIKGNRSNRRQLYSIQFEKVLTFRCTESHA